MKMAYVFTVASLPSAGYCLRVVTNLAVPAERILRATTVLPCDKPPPHLRQSKLGGGFLVRLVFIPQYALSFERALLVTFAPNFKSDILTYVQ